MTRPVTAAAGIHPAGDPLAAILAELRAIRLLLEQQQRPATLTRSDRERLARALPAIGGVLGSELFTSRDLVVHPSRAVQIAVRGLSVKQLGRLLMRAEGQVVNGLVVERVGDEGHVALWRIAGC